MPRDAVRHERPDSLTVTGIFSERYGTRHGRDARVTGRVHSGFNSYVTSTGCTSLVISASSLAIGSANLGISAAFLPCSYARKPKMYVSFAGRHWLKYWRFLKIAISRAFSALFAAGSFTICTPF